MVAQHKKRCGQVAYYVSTAQVPRVYMYANCLEFINLYYIGPESTDIDSEQAQQ